MQQNILLISIHPEHAKNIFLGTKTVELRRTRPKVSSGDKVVLYISSPVKILAGYFEVKDIVEDCPQKMWDTIGSKTAISKKEYSHYYENKKRAVGILIKKAKELKDGISLSSLRKSVPGFHPPQSYRYLTDKEIKKIGIVFA